MSRRSRASREELIAQIAAGMRFRGAASLYAEGDRAPLGSGERAELYRQAAQAQRAEEARRVADAAAKAARKAKAEAALARQMGRPKGKTP